MMGGSVKSMRVVRALFARALSLWMGIACVVGRERGAGTITGYRAWLIYHAGRSTAKFLA